MAYETVAGPLGGRYSDDMLAAIHEQLQALTQVCGQLTAAWIDANPKVDISHVPRRHEIYSREPESKPQANDPDTVSLETLISDFKKQGRHKN